MLSKVIKNLEEYTNSQVKLGVEIEFYTAKDLTFEEIRNILKCDNIEKETGKNQYEIKIGPSFDIKNISNQLIATQEALFNNPSFLATPKPFSDQPSSGIHFNINLVDKVSGKNLYEKTNNIESEILLFSIGGLLKSVEKNLQFFAPSNESLERFKPGMNNPTKICWGGNNRTVAIRIPSSDNGDRRIEHRLSASDCKLPETIIVILEAILDGIKNKTHPGEKVYGNAFRNEYDFKEILPLKTD